MTRAIDNSDKESYVLVEFIANGVPYRFTNWGTTIDPGGANWISMPALDVKWPKNTGTLQSTECLITAVSDANATMETLVDLLLGDGAPTPAVEIEITEVIRPVKIGDTASELVPFKGRLLKAVRNAGGKAKRVRFKVQNIKSRLDIPLGLPCNHHCPWSFMGRGCSVQGGIGARGPQRVTEVRNKQVTAINGKEITVISDPAISGTKSFQFGIAQREGVLIDILDWDSGTPTVFVLRQQPPASWLNQTVVLVPGCDKTLATCDGAWGNQSNFGGIGYAIPAFNPHWEEGE